MPADIIFRTDHNLINKTLAGVAQSVERVALMTARDKPQGRGFEPLLRLFLYQAHQSSCSFAFCVVSVELFFLFSVGKLLERLIIDGLSVQSFFQPLPSHPLLEGWLGFIYRRTTDSSSLQSARKHRRLDRGTFFGTILHDSPSVCSIYTRIPQLGVSR
jgi:hypothetical protein